ncbi:MAG: hypothetical protein ACLRT4_18210 [Thomasclavelia sp.]
MTQYCRYCAYMCVGDVNFCEKKRITKTDKQCKNANKCKDFESNPIDALQENINGYKPRNRKQKEYEQMRWLDVD